MVSYTEKYMMSDRINKRINEVYNELEAMSPDERIGRLYAEITRLSGGREPTTIVMNQDFFAKWYYHCQEQGIDYLKWREVPILLERDAPAEIAVTYHIHGV